MACPWWRHPKKSTPATPTACAQCCWKQPPAAMRRSWWTLTRTQFCASAGVGVLARAHNRALAEGGELRLVMPTSASVLRVFAPTGIDQVIPAFPSLYEAVTPAPAAPRPRRRRRAKPGMRTRPGRPPADPGASTNPA